MFKRSILFLLSLLLVAGVFVPVISAQENVTITVLNYMDLTAPGTERTLKEVWYAFDEQHPNITVLREDLYLDAFHNKVEAYAAADKLPDVVYMWPGGRSTTLHTKGLVKDLRPLLGDEAQYYHEYATVDQAGGFLALIPSTRTSSHAMFVNVALLDELGLEVPETYEELAAMAPVLQAKGLDTVLMGAQDDWVLQSCLFSMLAGRFVGDEKFDEIKAGQAKFTDPEFMAALEFYAQLYADGVLSPKIMNTGYGEVKSLFAAGHAPFLIDGDWAAGNFVTDESTGEALISPEDQKQIKMMVFPAIPGELHANSSSGTLGVGYGMSANIPDGSAKEAAAWELIKWLSGPVVQGISLETTGTLPSRNDVGFADVEPILEERIFNFYNLIEADTYILDDFFEADVFMPINIGLQEIGLGLATPAEVAEATQEAFDIWFAGQ
ncbi:MAG: extracellular solute-binding protein [Firmicutes bacterium]|nr:extracellular solute-binding protein [Bacillota bacterium]